MGNTNKNENIKNAIDFLAFSYFGSTFNDNDEIFDNALRVAFKDASLRGALVLKCQNKDKFDFSDDDKSLFRFIMREELIWQTKDYFTDNPITKIEAKKDFDDFHIALCDKLVGWFNKRYNELVCKKCPNECSENSRSSTTYFTYGNAQKFVNMMFKNLYIISLISKEYNYDGLKNIEKYIELSEWYHIPIDSYILEIVKDKNTTWSKIDEYSNYQDVQNTVKINLNTIDDEFPKWIKISKKHKKSDFESMQKKQKK